LLLAFLAFPAPLSAHRTFEEFAPAEGLLRIGPEPERQIHLTEVGHTLLLPDSGRAVRGLVVFFDPRRFDGWARPDSAGFDGRALAHDLAVLHLTNGNPLDFFFADSTIDAAMARVQALRAQHRLDEAPLFLAGMSLGGTRALRAAIRLAQTSRVDSHRLAAVAVVDAPLDFERMWESEGRSIERAFNEAAADQARWVRYLLEQNLGGTPAQAQEAYRRYSPFTYSAPGGGNAELLRALPIRAYHEPDVHWWMAQRHKTYRDINSIDMASFIVELWEQGNAAAELVTTHAARDGYPDATPHSWSIVDNRELVSWFLRQVAER
jgi:thioesterase domain-containing protein